MMRSLLNSKVLFSFLLFGGLIAGIYYLNEPEEQLVNQGKIEYPGEYMYNQRAYPNNYFNKKAIQQAMEQTQAIKNSRTIAQSEDWSFVGPLNTGGRITDIAISPDSDDTFYATAAVGGVFKTTDRGQSWTPIFDDSGVPSIGNIAIAPSDANRIYLGTGEANGSATSGAFFGNGVYRSDNAGDTWTNIGLPESNHIGRIVIDPQDSDRVFVAATGVLYGTNDERGIYRTTNGGDDWERVLFISDGTAAIDVAMNPDNTDILYAAMWERTRQPWQRDYGGLTSGVHRSTDGGDTWELLGNGLPAPDEQTGRIGLAVSASNPDVVYARYSTNEITNEFDALYRTTDGGASWTLFERNDLLGIDSSFGWYFGNVRVHPENEDEVFIIGQQFASLNPQTSNWDYNFQMHVDHHALEFSTTNPDFILAGNDGGLYISENRGQTYTQFQNLPITQMYNIEVDFQEPNNLFAGTQDNNTIRTVNGGDEDWFSIWGGDGFHVNVDPSDNSFAYAESQFGNLARSTNGGFSFTGATNGINSSDRNNWNTPVIISPFNPEVIYYGSNRLYQSNNRAVNWSPISPDLTDGEHPSGATSYGTLTAIAPSYNNLDTVYTGSDDGVVQVTFDGGTSWTDISEGLPDRYITSLAIHPADDNSIYATFSGFGLLDYTPHVFKSTDGGQNWNDISSNLPSIPANDIIIGEVGGEEVLFLGTDMNVWYSFNDGGSWIILGNNLPTTIIRDLKFHSPTGMLYAGTFGRSMHKFDLNEFVLSTDEIIAESNGFSIYPNPIVDRFKLEHNLTAQGEIALYDLTGKKIRTLYRGDLSNSQNSTFGRQSLSSGVYIVNIIAGNKQLSKKLIVQ